MIKAIVFDLDGTLISSMEFLVLQFKHTARIFGFHPPSREAVFSEMGKASRDMIHGLFGPMSPEKTETVRQEMVKYLRDSKAESVDIIEGAEEALRKLKKAGIKACIATNGSRAYLDVHLQRMRFRSLFDCTLSVTEIGKPKPCREVLEKAAAMLGVFPKEMIYTGDMWIDRETARLSGVRFIGVLSGVGKREELGDEVIDSVKELPAYLGL